MTDERREIWQDEANRRDELGLLTARDWGWWIRFVPLVLAAVALAGAIAVTGWVIVLAVVRDLR